MDQNLYALHCHNMCEKKQGADVHELVAVVYEMLYAKHCHKRYKSKSTCKVAPQCKDCSQLTSVICMKQTNTCLQG